MLTLRVIGLRRFVGMEKLEKYKQQKQGVLGIYYHSSHNSDIIYGTIAFQKEYGVVSRGLLHRRVVKFAPWIRYLGMVAGYRDTAEQLLKEGYFVGVIPGGGEEAMQGHENAYKLDWPASRRGFVKVAIAAQAPIVPIFYQSVEEMRFNLFAFVWNKLYGSVAYDAIVQMHLPYISAIVKFIGECVWFTLSWLSLPCLSKVTACIGEPIETKGCTEADIDRIRNQSYVALQRMIDKYQPDGIDRQRALQMWWQYRKNTKTDIRKES